MIFKIFINKMIQKFSPLYGTWTKALLNTLIEQPAPRLITDCARILILNLISLTFQADTKPPNKQFLPFNFSIYLMVKTFYAFTFHCITLSTKFIGEIFPKYSISLV